MFKSKYLLFSAALLSSLLLAGCTSSPPPATSNQPTPPPAANQTQIADVLKAKHPLAVIQQQQLLIVDPEYPSPQPVADLTSDEIPPVEHLFQFIISPNKKFIVWYAPTKGILSLDLASQQISVIHPASEWLNQNPYLVFLHGEDKLAFIDDKGTKLFFIDLPTTTTTSMTIPYPFGNVFRISPDNALVVFISGFGQSDKFPQYMFTTIDGQNPKRFITQTNLSKRGLIEWLPDSSGVIIVTNQSELLYVSQSSPNQQEIYYKLENPDSEITDLSLMDGLVYIFEDDKVWEVIDTTTHRRIARSPVEIAEEVYRPHFIPWYDKSFLIEETLRLDPEQFNRLWISNFLGIKKTVLDKYQETSLTSDTPEL